MSENKRKPATEITAERNRTFAVQNNLAWEDTQDFEDAKKGLIAEVPDGKIYWEGNVVFDTADYDFLNETGIAPDSINPSLWRLARLNTTHGLFKVTEGIYQVRGYDIAVITFIEGETGYIVIDTSTSVAAARAAYDLVKAKVGDKPVKAVIYTHSHTDHWAGVKGLISDEDVQSGKVRVIAPKGFMEFTVSEFVLGGPAMGRRAEYMFGDFLPVDEKGNVDVGLGKHGARVRATLIAPTDYVENTGEKLILDGVEFVFQLTPDAEAPAEMTVFLPKHRALCTAEICTHVLHNVYTIRGAQVRDAKGWAYYINEAIELFGDDTEVVFPTHHWPVWGHENVLAYLKKQRDAYKYIHDQTLRLASHGYTLNEIAEQIRFPKSLEEAWHIRGNYGSLSHNAKAVYQRYFGYYDGNPATLNQLPPEEAGKKYVEAIGGADKALAIAGKAFENGEYRWSAQLSSHIVFAEPENRDGRMLLADSLEQLGYAAEAAPWRNAYLAGAFELRGCSSPGRQIRFNEDIIRALEPEHIFDMLSIRLNGPKADGKVIALNFVFTDLQRSFALKLENATLNYFKIKDENPDATLSLTKDDFVGLLAVPENERLSYFAKHVKLTGTPGKVAELFGLLDNFETDFNIVEP
ncbi:alkyl sulfatase [Clostridia bacterium]|nr:alkyl sulfatase [Clostridia bacterium]